MTFEPHPGRVVQKSVDQENLAPRISDVHSMEDVEASIEELISGPSHITITGAFDGTGFSDRDYTQRMDERHRYSGQLLYEYNVHGRLWLNRDLWLHIPTVELSNSSLSEMNRLFELRVGDPLVVYVNPRNAAQAVLMRGPHPADAEAGASPWPLASAASFSVSVCFFILAFCLHRRRWKVANRQVP
jgi:hypothetical protein